MSYCASHAASVGAVQNELHFDPLQGRDASPADNCTARSTRQVLHGLVDLGQLVADSKDAVDACLMCLRKRLRHNGGRDGSKCSVTCTHSVSLGIVKP